MASKQGKRLNPFQHALNRPDTYIGSCVTVTKNMLVCVDGDDDDQADYQDEVVPQTKFVMKNIRYNPGMFKIFGEAQSNAIDNKWRSIKHGIVMKNIEFYLDNDPLSEWYGYITVKNDGYCIPVEQSEYEYEDYRNQKIIKEIAYPAEVFFGEMLAGTNFEEAEKKRTSGRNGMGGKTCVIFSLDFIIEHTDPATGKKFYQQYTDHGKIRTKPKITSYSGKIGYTSVCFLPDYEYFGYGFIDDDFVSLCKRYAYETAMITGLNVTFNEEKISVKSLEKFVRMIYPNAKDNCLITFTSPTGDECVLVENGVPEMEQIEDVNQHSWINGINTKNGGTHVAAWRDAIFPSLVKTFNSRKAKKGEKTVLKTTAKQMYPYFTLFVRSEVDNPQFDGQPKDQLTVPEVFDLTGDDKNTKKDFSNDIVEKLKKVMKWNFVELLEEKLAAKNDSSRSKKEGIKKRVAYGDKVKDANYAGTSYSYMCILYITEGDSAKTFADGLISKIPEGNDYYGTMAIKGKFINAQKASVRDLNSNDEVKMLKNVLGLRTGVHYDNLDECRYGAVCIFADQDEDGEHIKGLLLNYFYTAFPSLLKMKCYDDFGYCRSFTSLVTYNVKRGKITDRFYSNPQYKKWYESQDKSQLNGVTSKYLKGLGSHKPGDEKLYIDDMKIVDYCLDGNEDYYMMLGFNPKESDWRKKWITKDMIKPGSLFISGDLDEKGDGDIQIQGTMSLSKFIDEQLIIYDKMVLFRALPCMYDSFKDSQRRIFYGMKTHLSNKHGTVGLARLMGSVAELSNYHHGEKSLEETSIGMAQGFVGSNNIPFLVNDGQFGTRSKGGKDHAASRYIATKVEDICESIYMKEDEPILESLIENDTEGKPMHCGYKFYMPIVCMCLANGISGIAVGFSSTGANYNPVDIINSQKIWLDYYDRNEHKNKQNVILPTLVPWYRGFKGEIELLESSGQKTPKYKTWSPESENPPIAWRSKGILEEPGKYDKGYWKITELPIGLWTGNMKSYLEYLWTGTPPEGSKKKKAERNFISDLKWNGSPNTVNWSFKPSKDFIPDIEVVGNFKIMQTTGTLTNMNVIDENGYPRTYKSTSEILKDYCLERVKYYKKRKTYWLNVWRGDLKKELSRKKFLIAVRDKKIILNQEEAKIEESMVKMGLVKVDNSFDYLFDMKIRTMTPERLIALEKTIENIRAKIFDYETTSESDMWRRDMEAFLKAWQKFLKTRKEECED